MSLDLKHILCPAGDGCTAYKCIFGHQRDTSPCLVTDQSSVAEAIDNGQTPAKPASKRPKLDATEPGSSRNGRGKQNPVGTVPSTRRSISPPPVRRVPLPRPPAPREATGTAGAAEQPTKAKASPEKAKPESLNPRLIKHSPASHEIRLKLLKLLHGEIKRLNDELKLDANDDEMQLVLSEQALIKRALDEEELIAVGKASVYANVMKNKVMSYKRQTTIQWKEERQKEAAATTKKRTHNDVDGAPVVIQTGLTLAQEFELLPRLYTPIGNLSNHGYVPEIPTQEVIQKARDGMDAAKGWEKCDRCEQRFQVFPGRREDDGALTSGGPCRFHWGRMYFPDRNPGEKTSLPKRYRCCGQEIGDSAGCVTHSDHVFKASDSKRLAAVMNYAATPENPDVPADRAVCFDCEMGYTVHGMELIRLTATLWPSGEELIDVLVKPIGETLDLNSRFSGVTTEDLTKGDVWSAGDSLRPVKNAADNGSEDGEIRSKTKHLKVVPSPSAARDLLFSQISPTTPLIGHGLENDLNAMRIVHPTIIDTILLYPHKNGLPYRHGLRVLMDRHLNKKIQQETGPTMLGHDSAEDARAAGELVHFKLMERWHDMKRAGWKLVDGKITSPAERGNLTEEFLESSK